MLSTFLRFHVTPSTIENSESFRICYTHCTQTPRFRFPFQVMEIRFRRSFRQLLASCRILQRSIRDTKIVYQFPGVLSRVGKSVKISSLEVNSRWKRNVRLARKLKSSANAAEKNLKGVIKEANGVKDFPSLPPPTANVSLWYSNTKSGGNIGNDVTRTKSGKANAIGIFHLSLIPLFMALLRPILPTVDTMNFRICIHHGTLSTLTVVSSLSMLAARIDR